MHLSVFLFSSVPSQRARPVRRPIAASISRCLAWWTCVWTSYWRGSSSRSVWGSRIPGRPAATTPSAAQSRTGGVLPWGSSTGFSNARRLCPSHVTISWCCDVMVNWSRRQITWQSALAVTSEPTGAAPCSSRETKKQIYFLLWPHHDVTWSRRSLPLVVFLYIFCKSFLQHEYLFERECYIWSQLLTFYIECLYFRICIIFRIFRSARGAIIW